MSRTKTARRIPAKPAARQQAPDSSPAARLAWYAVLAAVAVIPVTMPTFAMFGAGGSLMADPFSLSKLLMLRILTLTALAAWGFDLLKRGGRIRHTPVDWLVLAFVVWIGLTTLNALHWPTALVGKYHRDEGFLTFVNYAVLYFLVVQLADKAARIRTLALALFASGFAVAGYGALQYFSLDPIPWNIDFAQRAFSTYGNPNILGGFLTFTIPVSLGLALCEQNARVRMLFWAGFFVNAFVLVASFTRAAWIGAVVAVVLTSVIATRHAVRLTRLDAVPTAVAGIFTAVVVAVQSRIEPDRVLPIADVGTARLLQADPGGITARLMIWRATLSAIAERPLLGYGSDSLRLVFPRHKPVQYVRISDNVADSPHNYPLQLAVGSGILATVLFYAVLAWTALRTAPLVFRKTDDPGRIIYGSFWAASAGYVANLMFGLSLPGVTFLLWTALAVLLAPTATSRPLRAPRWGLAVGITLTAACAAAILLQIPVLRADRAYLLATRADAGAAAPAAAAEAVRLNPLSHAYREHWGFSYLSEALRQLGEAEKAAAASRSPATFLQAAERNLQAGERTMRATIEWIPDDAANYQYLATLYNLRGDLLGDESDFERAIETATEARKIDPWSVALRFEHAYALRALGRVDEAVAELKEALDILPGHDRSALLLAGIYEDAGDRAAALTVLREANAARPEQPAIVEAVKLLERGGSLLEP